MTAVTRTPGPLEAYLHRATLGLPAQQRDEVWNELEEYVLCRAEQLEFGGYTPEQALSQALRELGQPLRVSAAMNGVHNMPRLIAFGTLGMLAVSAGLYALAGGRTQQALTLPILTERPVTPSCVRGTKPSGNHLNIVSEKDGITCYTFKDARAYRGAYLSLSSLRTAMNAQGANVQAGQKGEYIIKYDKGGSLKMPPFFSDQGEKYFLVAAVASSIMGQQPNQAHLTGYAQPRLYIRDLQLQFGQQGQDIGDAFYRGLGIDLLSYVLHDHDDDNMRGYTIGGGDLTGKRQQTLQTRLAPGEVVMLVTKRAGANYDATFAPVQQDGSATFSTPFESLRIVTDTGQLGPYLSGGRMNALLVRVTNIPISELKKGILSVESVK